MVLGKLDGNWPSENAPLPEAGGMPKSSAPRPGPGAQAHGAQREAWSASVPPPIYIDPDPGYALYAWERVVDQLDPHTMVKKGPLSGDGKVISLLGNSPDEFPRKTRV